MKHYETKMRCAAPKVEEPAEDGSAMEWGGAKGRGTRRGWLCNGGRVGKKQET